MWLPMSCRGRWPRLALLLHMLFYSRYMDLPEDHPGSLQGASVPPAALEGKGLEQGGCTPSGLGSTGASLSSPERSNGNDTEGSKTFQHRDALEPLRQKAKRPPVQLQPHHQLPLRQQAQRPPHLMHQGSLAPGGPSARPGRPARLSTGAKRCRPFWASMAGSNPEWPTCFSGVKSRPF